MDQELISKYLAGDEESLEILIKKYLKPIYNFTYRYAGNSQEAEDITQETFLKAWKNLKKFNPQKSFKTWIFSIAKNTAIDWLRKKKTIPFPDDIIETIADPSPFVPEFSLTAVLEKLPTKYQIVLSLRYNDYFTFREIAEILEEPLHTVKSRHRRGLAMLKNTLY